MTRAMRGHGGTAEAIISSYLRKMAGTLFLCFGFVSYRRCFQHSQPPFCAVGHFVCFFCSFGCSFFCRLFGFRELIKQTSTATSAMATSREIHRLNIKSFLIDVVFGVVTVAA